MGNNKSKENEVTDLLETHTDHTDSINCICVADDESVIVTGSEDKTARLWTTKDPKGSECLGTLKSHYSYTSQIALSFSAVLLGLSSRTLYYRHLHNSTSLSAFPSLSATLTDPCFLLYGHKKTVHPLIYISADESKGEEDLVITGSTDSTAKLWTLDSGTCLKTYANHKGPVMVMTKTNSGRIPLQPNRDIATAKQLKVYESHNTEIMCLSVVNKLMYSGDCAGLWNTAVGYGDVRGFEAKTSALVKTLTTKDSTQVINCMAICNDKLFSCSQDGKMRYWDISNIGIGGVHWRWEKPLVGPQWVRDVCSCVRHLRLHWLQRLPPSRSGTMTSSIEFTYEDLITLSPLIALSFSAVLLGLSSRTLYYRHLHNSTSLSAFPSLSATLTDPCFLLYVCSQNNSRVANCVCPTGP
nr:WD repeat-containing protein 86-like [Cherax quadricarinatus]